MTIFKSPYQPVTPISTRGLIRVDGWYGIWYENSHIIIYHSFFFLIRPRVCLFDIIYRVKGKTAKCSECGMFFCFLFLPRQKNNSLFPIFPCDWWYEFFCLDTSFLPRQKKPYHPGPIITLFALHISDVCLKAMFVSHAAGPRSLVDKRVDS